MGVDARGRTGVAVRENASLSLAGATLAGSRTMPTIPSCGTSAAIEKADR